MQENQSNLLQNAISELKNSPTVDIKGKSYTQVSTRINIFRKYFPNARIETLITYNDDIRVVIQTKISIDNNLLATGYAEEIRGDGNYINKTSAIENCETSSIGRALSNFGLGGSEYASSFEVENAISQQQNHNNQPINNRNQTNQQNSNYTPNNQHIQKQQAQTPYINQQDFSQLTNLGLAVVKQDENLIVLGENVFANKDVIKNHGFRWDGGSKTWYMNLRQVA